MAVIQAPRYRTRKGNLMLKQIWPLATGLLVLVAGLAAMPVGQASAATAGTGTVRLHALPFFPNNWIGTEIVNRYSNRCIDDPGSSTSPGAYLQQWECNGTGAQQWAYGTDSLGNTYI
jgi:Ricin-type beta-trefoil lectin domain-like